MKRIIWKVGCVIKLKLRENLFTVSQMMGEPFMAFFPVFQSNTEFKNLDLSEIKPLFCVPIDRSILKEFAIEKMTNSIISISRVEIPEIWIKPHLAFETGQVFKGGRLIKEKWDNVESDSIITIIPDLTIQHKDIINNHEVTNMRNAEDIVERLIEFYETGINRDKFKQDLFKHLF